MEDSNSGFETLRKVLNNYPKVVVFRATSIESALETLDGGRFDMILLDHHLAGENGFGFFDQMRTAGIELSVIVVAGHGDELTAARCIRSGASGYLSTADICNETVERAITSGLLKTRSRKDIKILTQRGPGFDLTPEGCSINEFDNPERWSAGCKSRLLVAEIAMAIWFQVSGSLFGSNG